MRNRWKVLLLVGVCVTLISGIVWSHCEIPCGIYDDQARIDMLREHATTIEKSMTQIEALTKAEDRNDNQITRWIMNKEDHANKAQEVVTQYFMTQRIKPADEGAAKEKYIREITQLHQMMIALMKCKQTTDVKHVESFRALVDAFEASYMNKQEAAHDHEH